MYKKSYNQKHYYHYIDSNANRLVEVISLVVPTLICGALTVLFIFSKILNLGIFKDLPLFDVPWRMSAFVLFEWMIILYFVAFLINLAWFTLKKVVYRRRANRIEEIIRKIKEEEGE